MLSESGEVWRQFDVIAIDEGQFFPDVSENYNLNSTKLWFISVLSVYFNSKNTIFGLEWAPNWLIFDFGATFIMAQKIIS